MFLRLKTDSMVFKSESKVRINCASKINGEEATRPGPVGCGRVAT